MEPYHWYGIGGLLMLTAALLEARLRSLPVTTTILYLVVGLILGPVGFGALHLDLIRDAPSLEIIAEIAVVVSVFSVGLKIRVKFSWENWDVPLRLIFISMPITIGLIAVTAYWLLGIPPAAAILLGALLAPTDPVLASDVQLPNPHLQDRFRFGLTSEAGMNDGAAMPFVVLALALMGYRELGDFAWKWMLGDILWGVLAGLAIGAFLGIGSARLVIFLRRHHAEAVGADELIAFGLLFLSYSAASILQANGFLAVFAAGVAVRTVERRFPRDLFSYDRAEAESPSDDHNEGDDDDPTQPAHMAKAILRFNEQTESLLQVVLVLLVGGLLAHAVFALEEILFALLLFCVIRPVSVFVGLSGTKRPFALQSMLGWFGVRGITSVYYLAYLHNFEVSKDLIEQLASVTLLTIVLSIVIHGVTVTPLMNWYSRRRTE